MAQYCPHCKWYSADGLTHCSTCGAQFEDAWEAEPEDQTEAEPRPLVERIGWAVALAAGAVVGGMALYGRFGTPENLGAAGAFVSRAAASVKAVLGSLYAWLIGPNQEYKDFVTFFLLASAFLWIALWIVARLRR
jgi:hypothetical protein